MKIAGPLTGRRFPALMLCVLLLFMVTTDGAWANCQGEDAAGEIVVERLHSRSGEGQGYRLIYCVAVPIETYWQFKTDFQNDFLTDNPHIATHRFVQREGSVVQTENRYTHNKKRLFRWQTTVHDNQYRLDFKLLNLQEAGQKFHFGTIRIEACGRRTMIHQQARFQFSGAAFWVFYPWRGGMRSFLKSFAIREQQASRSWQSRSRTNRRREDQTQAHMWQVSQINERYPEK